MNATKMREREVVALIRAKYCKDHGNGPAAVLLPQVRNAAGFDATRTADAIVMNLWPSRGLHLEGFEVKCSRADVLKELRDPSKAEAFSRYCEKWWLVVASECLIKEEELPEPWGLLVVSGDGERRRLAVRKEAPVNYEAPKVLPKSLLAAMMRQFARPDEEELRMRYQEGFDAGMGTAEMAAEMDAT